MRWFLALSIVPAVAVSLPAAAQLPSPTPTQASAVQRIKSHYATGDKAQAEEDADASASEGEFSLVTSSNESDEPAHPLGVICYTPYGHSPSILMDIGAGDYIPPELGRKLEYGAAYNQALVERVDYPFRDLCAVRGINQTVDAEDPWHISKPARSVIGAPRDVFDAARRGSARDVRRLILRSSLDTLDSFGMTPLAWAVARNNQPAIEALLTAGANPWVLRNDHYGYRDTTAVYWAAALGHRSTFLRLQRLKGRPFEKGWPSSYLAAAMNSNDPVIFGTMLAQRHEAIRFEYLRRPWPEAAIFAMAVKKQRDLATPLLFKGVSWDDYRPELVRLALAYGADPNADDNGETALARVSSGVDDSSLEIVDMLLKAGADPNQPGDYGRPIWRAFDIMREGSSFPAYRGRAKVIFEKLLAAGADLNLPDGRGLPPIWYMLFPYSPKHDQLDPYRATPEELERLASLGLDVNAEWQGKRVMGQVEEKAGPDAKLTKMLRKLGAKP